MEQGSEFVDRNVFLKEEKIERIYVWEHNDIKFDDDVRPRKESDFCLIIPIDETESIEPHLNLYISDTKAKKECEASFAFPECIPEGCFLFGAMRLSDLLYDVNDHESMLSTLAQACATYIGPHSKLEVTKREDYIIFGLSVGEFYTEVRVHEEEVLDFLKFDTREY